MSWWAAASIIDVAPYIWDAFDPKMMLLGGKTGAESDGHDWQNILGDLGLIRKAHLIGNLDKLFGLAVMILAWAWAAMLLRLQFRNKNDAIVFEHVKVTAHRHFRTAQRCRQCAHGNGLRSNRLHDGLTSRSHIHIGNITNNYENTSSTRGDEE